MNEKNIWALLLEESRREVGIWELPYKRIIHKDPRIRSVILYWYYILYLIQVWTFVMKYITVNNYSYILLPEKYNLLRRPENPRMSSCVKQWINKYIPHNTDTLDRSKEILMHNRHCLTKQYFFSSSWLLQVCVYLFYVAFWFYSFYCIVDFICSVRISRIIWYSHIWALKACFRLDFNGGFSIFLLLQNPFENWVTSIFGKILSIYWIFS